MTNQLEAIFGELGISQYLDIFVDQGFDTWETILDITESDLDALGVKLGHRRKLQRRIANFRGLSLETSLVSPTAPPPVDEPKPEPQPTATAVKVETQNVAAVVVAKRKYRRHPKPDENAPERPPSAYVLFSNKMRDDLKGRNLTFTEIAKLVGEHWQNLSVAEKEPFESQAQTAKDKYNNQLAEYKKTPEYRRYQEYLEEFKSRYAHQSKDKDASKRVKLSPGAPGHNDRKATANHSRPSRSGSGSPNPNIKPGDQQAYRRHHRLSSVVSATDSHVSPTPAFRHASLDDAVHSPLDRRSSERSPVIRASPRDLGMAHRRGPLWHDDQGAEPPRLLPSLSDVFDPRGPLSSGHSTADINGFPFPRSYNSDSVGPPPGLVESERKMPTLKKEQSSAGSISSGSSYSYPRTPIEGSLPIHALLSEKPPQPINSIMQFHGNPMAADHKSPFLHRQPPDGIGMPYTNGMFTIANSSSQMATSNNHPQGFASHAIQQSALVPTPTQQATPLPTPLQTYPRQVKPNHPGVKPEPDLDGMSALLRAGEIVDKRSS
ncbi:hypothetical protein GE09DRAFT_1167989 [Coniochaeta sp. 2T2.1]|nr:hypothetical protein GE09DRAFT_1167989 [Coniochaeta sp. 2T2.1]